MELAESIKDAWAAVEKSGVPTNMQELAFKEALRLVLATGAPAAAVRAGSTNATAKQQTNDGDESNDGGMDEAAMYAALEGQTQVSVDRLERLFHVDDNVIKLSVTSTALGKTDAERTRTTAVLLAVIRKVCLEQETPFQVIRDEANRKGFLDAGNFTKHLRDVDGLLVKGDKPANKRLEARTAAITAFPDLVTKVLGES